MPTSLGTAHFSHSKLTYLAIEDVSASSTDISTYCDSFELPRDLESVETTTFGALSKTYVLGFEDSSGSFEGPWDPEFDAMMETLFAAFRAGTLESATFVYGPNGNDSGKVKKTGELVLTNYTSTNGISDPVRWSGEFRITGAVTVTTF
jgi:hypothetical protein